MAAVKETIETARALEADKYAAGFITDIEQEFAPIGLNEEIVRYISAKKDEPQWMLDWRLEAFARWKTLIEPSWALRQYRPIDYQGDRY